MPSPRPAPPIVLTLSAADPSGGAGIQASALTLASLGCHPLSVVTALTVRDSRNVDAIQVVDADFVLDQARMLLEDMPIAAFCVGMTGSAENVAAITELVTDYPDIPLVFDPVLASSGEYASTELIDSMRELLIPHATLITPNRAEARHLALNEPDEEDEPEAAEYARRLLALGCEYVLLSGSQDTTSGICNLLYGQHGEIRRDRWQRLPGSYYGAGCTLAAAIAGMVAGGARLPEAVREAQEYTWQALRYAFRPGMGHAIPDRLFWASSDAEDDVSGED
ncbi:bifunctional hydroxymethylpyrimidine kinase/phosphomethylpyrimidine kinase [Crenobacter intestini]|uniref:hydroxymethylpyrimidine kinase n=1 Tax=Crenobacter intestini TaxID=2563443 RepID=A0A4T0UP88_9NEIS|nr:hydroxymethylpyrimidine/phosphomethylpyrimidine kinase [Crenobacter intestini]TIC80580.1 hydroxymethylpyrimidine/phosphomethylpyrimidine kinase [Crenobacter intestini]